MSVYGKMYASSSNINWQCRAEINIYEVCEPLLGKSMKDLITKVDIWKHPDISNYLDNLLKELPCSVLSRLVNFHMIRISL